MNKPRMIITTDVEVDDMNSLIHLCLYLNEIDLLAVIYTSSQYHFLGDGIHTLGEVTPHYRTSGPAGLVRPRVVQGPDPDADKCLSFRPFHKGWIEELFDREYRAVYPQLKKHDDSYPDPDHLISITKYGNIDFEGDVSFDTPGSQCICDYLLDDCEQPLYLLSWGGVNTIVRSLLAIYQKYSVTPEWNNIYDRIIRKTRLLGVINGVGQDNSFLDNRINELYPDLMILRSEDHYGGYLYSLTAPESMRYMLKGNWMLNNIVKDNGPLMAAYHLMGDGKTVEGEPDIYQFGINAMIDFGKPGVAPFHFEKNEFLGEGDSNTYIPLLTFGLRGLENYDYSTVLGRINVTRAEFAGIPDENTDGKKRPESQFVKAYQQDWAARAKWCVCEPDEATHPVEIRLSDCDVFCKPVETVEVSYEIVSRDKVGFTTKWTYYPQYSVNDYDNIEIKSSGNTLKVTIPATSKPGDYYNLVLSVTDNSDRPITTYAQLIIHVK